MTGGLLHEGHPFPADMKDLLREVLGLVPECIHTPGILVDRIVQTVSEKRIEQRTVRS